MSKLENKVDAIFRYLTAEEGKERTKAFENMKHLMREQAEAKNGEDAEHMVCRILLELGAPDHLVGHPYVVQAILLVLEDRSYINNITTGLYPELAARFDTTASRVERAIRHVVEVAWMRGDPDVLCKYFGNTVSAEKGKPTNGEFIARMANVIKLQMRQ
jgi:two-component system response regulator (stage 0 sporulation protein A)